MSSTVKIVFHDLVIVVPHLFIALLQEDLGLFSVISFQVWKTATKFLLKLLTPRLNIPCSSSLPACSVCSSPQPRWWPLDGPRMSANHLTSCMWHVHIHKVVSMDFYCSSSDTPRYVWALSNVGQIQKLIYFFPRSLNKSVSILSILCSFVSLQRTGFEGLSVAGRVFLFNVIVKYLRV